MNSDNQDLISQLERLSDLHENGRLTAREFSQAKKQLLDKNEAVDIQQGQAINKIGKAREKMPISHTSQTQPDSSRGNETPDYQQHLRTPPKKNKPALNSSSSAHSSSFHLPEDDENIFEANREQRKKKSFLPKDINPYSSSMHNGSGTSPKVFIIPLFMVIVFFCFALYTCNKHSEMSGPHSIKWIQDTHSSDLKEMYEEAVDAEFARKFREKNKESLQGIPKETQDALIRELRKQTGDSPSTIPYLTPSSR